MTVESKSNGNNLNNVSCKTNSTFRNKKVEYLKEKINTHEINRIKQSEIYIQA